jgi:uncharacterized protein YdaU (DUF1376 family)
MNKPDPEDEAFNEIERMSRARKESVKMSMLKPKTADEFYNELREKVLSDIWAEHRVKVAQAVAKEREACIEACRKTITSQRSAWGANFCMEAIRARGQA